MIASLPTLDHDDTLSVLRTVLRDLHGPTARLEECSATPLTKRGRQRVVCYTLRVRLADEPEVRHYQWVGKFYARPEEGQRVAALLQELQAAGCGPRGGFVTPRVFAYDATRGLLVLRYESGESITKAIARDAGTVLAATGRALAVLHTVAVDSDTVTDAPVVLHALRTCVTDLASHFPSAAAILRAELGRLSQALPRVRRLPALLHGDLGTAQLLWCNGSLVMLDFDGWTRGDPALDLGALLTQLRRLTLRKPGKLPAFDSMRTCLVEAYLRSATDDASLWHRVAWYERATLLKKIHSLVFDVTRRPEAGALQQRRAEARRLLELCERDAA